MATKKKSQETDSTAKVDRWPSGKSSAVSKESNSKPAKENKREEPKRKDGDSQLLDSIGTIRQFLREVGIEFKKISWPGRTQVIQETYSVLFLVALITLMVLAFDWFLGHAIFGPLEHWARLHGGGIGKG